MPPEHVLRALGDPHDLARLRGTFVPAELARFSYAGRAKDGRILLSNKAASYDARQARMGYDYGTFEQESCHYIPVIAGV